MAHRGHPEFTLADGTPVSPGKWWGGDEPEDTLEGSKARLGRLKLGEQYPADISTDSARGQEMRTPERAALLSSGSARALASR